MQECILKFSNVTRVVCGETLATHSNTGFIVRDLFLSMCISLILRKWTLNTHIEHPIVYRQHNKFTISFGLIFSCLLPCDNDSFLCFLTARRDETRWEHVAVTFDRNFVDRWWSWYVVTFAVRFLCFSIFFFSFFFLTLSDFLFVSLLLLLLPLLANT